MLKKDKKKPNKQINTENKLRNEKERATSSIILLKNFFNKFFIIGAFTILISIIIEEQWIALGNELFFKNIFIKFLSSVGVALLIGSVFDFSKNSEGFMNYIAGILKEIIVSKNFLSGLEVKEKKNALEILLRPSGNQLEQCSDIEVYFKKKVEDITRMFNTNFKTNLMVNVTASKKDGIVVVDATLTYRVYKVEDKYFPLKTTFERNGCQITKASIIYPGGEKEITEEDATAEQNEDISPTNIKTFKYEIPDELYKYPYLTIKKIVRENGYDHWTNFQWNTLTPSDGINFSLRCMDGLHIKEYFIFDDETLYNTMQNDDKDYIEIISSQWLEKNSGFLFTISDTKE